MHKHASLSKEAVGGGARAWPAAAGVPLIAHVIDRLDFGGMENGLINLINGTPPERFRHAVICLRQSARFRERIRGDDVSVFDLGKRPGKDVGIYLKVWRQLRALRPAIVHTRNLPAIDMAVPAFLAGVPCRVHGEHGRDVLEIDGRNRKYNLMRRAVSPFVDHYVAVSRDIERWLGATIGIPEKKIAQIHNGVDTGLFHPAAGGRAPLPGAKFSDTGSVIVGTVGRMETVKDQLTLVRAFIGLVAARPDLKDKLRLVLAGDGSLLPEARRLLGEAGLSDHAWLPGFVDDIPAVMRGLDIFVLPSLNEGISNTILEAMASGLPVIATAVGGNEELLIEGETGLLVPSGTPVPMADAIARYLDDPGLTARHGRAGRERVEREFSLTVMVAEYLALYDRVLSAKGKARAAP
ncbi:MAG: TIGR03088 family PEP-CTERM/XrtA system glycosyltransferase [Rhodospirillales bacterium]|nr:TIGR03088 family PEP-CTERM/XrtA system glycosyltransferase [Rhodospirillales bacterium]